MKRRLLAAMAAMVIGFGLRAAEAPMPEAGRWTVERVQAWYDQQPWMVGCNFLPSTAINQVEMFQPGTYDPVTIRRELGWARELGFNTLRVFLHDILWKDEVRDGFLKNFDDFLGICETNGMRCIVVFFDDCHWDHDIKLGPQQPRITGVHNSGWFKSPGSKRVDAYADGSLEPLEQQRLQEYVQGVLRRYRNDPRIVMWDIYNEPGLAGTRVLLKDAWAWAREADPAQPLTGCVFGSGKQYQDQQGGQSDVLTYHCYDTAGQQRCIDELRKKYPGRPVVCTEYMIRPQSSFQSCLPVLKANGVGAINWGLVNGKSGTVWAWPSQDPLKKIIQRPDWSLREIERKLGFDCPAPGQNYPEPPQWFQDILRVDGTPFDAREITSIKRITGKLPPLRALVPTAEKDVVTWRYTVQRPADDWFQPEYCAAGWKEGAAGFGARITPCAVIRTEWSTAEIWLRREFVLPDGRFADAELSMHHDEDAEVYINGVLAARVGGYNTAYESFELSPESRAALKPGKNVMAVHCRQSIGGQCIDAGLLAPGSGD